MPKLGTFKTTRNIPWQEEAQQFAQMAMMAAGVINSINKQKEEKLQAETEKNLKIMDLNFKIMSDKNMPSGAKLGAYNTIRDIGGKSKLFELPELTSWTDPYNEFGKKGAGIFQSFLKGNYDKDTALNAFAQLSSEAQDKESLEAIKPFKERVESLAKERQLAGITKQMQPQQIPTGEPDIGRWGGVPMAMPQKTMAQEPDYEKILSNIPPELKDAPVVKMLEEKIKGKKAPETKEVGGRLYERREEGWIPVTKKEPSTDIDLWRTATDPEAEEGERKRAWSIIGGRHKLSLEEKQAGKTIFDLSGLADREMMQQTIKILPAMREKAQASLGSYDLINTALDLVEKGVTGKGGQVKAVLAPYAEWLGYKGEELSDAQAFQLMSRVITGPMRTDIVGPGPVTEWEQKLMITAGGGGGAAKSAAITLLKHWRKRTKSNIDTYNDTVKGMSSMFPNIKTLYSPIEIEGKSMKEMPSVNPMEELKIRARKGDRQAQGYLKNKNIKW